jgi:hypothetical protein
MAGGSASNESLGQKVIITGLALQLVFFGFFIVVSGLFHRRMAAYPTAASFSIQFSWRRHIFALYTASVLIILRSIFRVAEYVQGSEGELLKHEIYLFVFDAALMWILMVVLNVIHPGEIAAALLSNLKSTTGERLEMQPGDDSSQEGESMSTSMPTRTRPTRAIVYARHGLA